MPKLIADVGSTHGGDLVRAKQAVLLLAQKGIPMIKFQLCSSGSGNIPVDPLWLPDLVSLGKSQGASVSCSVWDRSGLDSVIGAKCTWVKIAHSGPRNLIDPALQAGLVVVCTRQLMESWIPNPRIINLWTYETDNKPQYPVTCLIDHRDMQPRFQGFSCHGGSGCLSDAIKANYPVVEYHVNAGYDNCPDARFALSI